MASTLPGVRSDVAQDVLQQRVCRSRVARDGFGCRALHGASTRRRSEHAMQPVGREVASAHDTHLAVGGMPCVCVREREREGWSFFSGGRLLQAPNAPLSSTRGRCGSDSRVRFLVLLGLSARRLLALALTALCVLPVARRRLLFGLLCVPVLLLTDVRVPVVPITRVSLNGINTALGLVDPFSCLCLSLTHSATSHLPRPDSSTIRVCVNTTTAALRISSRCTASAYRHQPAPAHPRRR